MHNEFNLAQLFDLQADDFKQAVRTTVQQIRYLPCITMYLSPNKKKLSDQSAFICKEIQQIWFLAMQLCRILHDTHSVLYLLQR
jgi:predicted NAD/FAD-dependent oxidoreductase